MISNIFALVIISLFLTSCIIISPAELSDPEPFNDDVLTTLKIGVSTKDDVRSSFDSFTYQAFDSPQINNLPPMVSDDNYWWYYTLIRELSAIIFCGIAEDIDCYTYDRGARYSYLLLKFNRSEILEGYWRTHEELSCSQKYACIRNQSFIIPATLESNNQAEMFEPNRNYCNLYVYTTRQNETLISIKIKELETYIGTRKSFTLIEVDEGHSKLKFTDSVNNSAELEFTCIPPQNHFIEVTQNPEGLKISQINERSGKRSVSRKYLVSNVVPLSSFSFPIEETNKFIDVVPLRKSDFTSLENKNSERQYNRAMQYVKQKNPLAWENLCLAANLGHGEAQHKLAYWHREDIRLPDVLVSFRSNLTIDNRIAYMWYRLAELNGVQNAKYGKVIMAKKLSEQRLVEAMDMVKNWEPGHCPAPPNI